jgi:hypothetical protein
MRDMTASPPGFRWTLILALAGFAAGFIGPMIFAPDSNQGPLVGILISGPSGLVAGAVLWLLCALFKPAAKTQWQVLYGVAAVIVLTTLIYVQPEPKVRGYVFDGEVESCSTVSESASEVLDYWDQRIAEVTWASPRVGWRADMQRLLREAPGVVVSVRIQHKNAIKENRKPWNRGAQFAAGRSTQEDEVPFHDPDGTCDQYPDGSAIRAYQKSDSEERLRSADIWPPKELLYVLRASAIAAVPEEWKTLSLVTIRRVGLGHRQGRHVHDASHGGRRREDVHGCRRA